MKVYIVVSHSDMWHQPRLSHVFVNKAEAQKLRTELLKENQTAVPRDISFNAYVVSKDLDNSSLLSTEQKAYLCERASEEGFVYYFVYKSEFSEFADEEFHRRRKALIEAIKNLEDYIDYE